MKIQVIIDTEAQTVAVKGEKDEYESCVHPSSLNYSALLSKVTSCMYVHSMDIFELPTDVFSYLEDKGII